MYENIEEYLVKEFKNVDINILTDLLFKEKYFYTLVQNQPTPKRANYLTQTFDKILLGLIFTSEKKIDEYKHEYDIVKDWEIIKYEMNDFEKYIIEVNKQIKGFIINYPTYWATLYFN